MKKSSLVILFISFTLILSAQQKIVPKPQTIRQTEKTADAPSGKFIGSVFSDFSYVLQEPQTLIPSKGISGMNAFVIRRASLGYEYSFNKNVVAAVEYDATTNVLVQGNVDVRNILPMMDLKLGLMKTLSSETMEKIWEYRALDAGVLDRKAYVHEFDKGFTFTSRLNPQGTMNVRIAAYNGNGTAAENNKLKKIAGAFGMWLDKSSVVEVYVDYENEPGGKSDINGKVLYGMATPTMGFGAEAFYRLERKQNTVNGKDINPVGVSVFSWFDMMRSLRGVLRVDGVEKDLADANSGYREVYLNVGVDYLPAADVHIIPNLIYVKNLKKGTSTEIVDRMEARLTAAVTLK